MSLKRMPAVLMGGLIAIIIYQTVDAAQSNSKLKVGISPFSPFVILTGDFPTGVSIDLWRELALKLNVDYEFVECTGVADKLKRLKEGRIDVAIGGITITEDREEIFDFTHPQFHTGLDILILRSDNSRAISIMAALFTKNKLIVLAGVLLLVFVAGHIIWLVERSSKKVSTTFHKNYFPGVFEGMYWALVTASTVGYGDKVPQRWVGRILAGCLIIIFLPIFGYFIAQLSSDLTVRNIKQNINGPQDLSGKRVAVIKGTTSEEYMQNRQSYIYPYDGIEDAYTALLAETVDALVYDAPPLLHYASGKGKDKVLVVGKIFALQDYAIALPQGSIWRERINRAALALSESGETKHIRSKWFGDENSL
ncbi:MAG: transporter substrate-binding domain-containing protein [Desulfobacterales bacterium]|jgi:polar amino acid transport system substrate-binding protein